MSEISAGYPTFVDGGYYPSALLREFDGGVSVQDAGSATAVSPAGGVFDPYTTALKVSAGTGMTVLVNAGSCSVPNHAGQGAYRFGLMAQATLTVAANSTGSTRLDYVLANVQDLLTTGSYAQIEYVTGTTSPPSVPNNSIILAEISVPNGASSIVSGDITDKRTFVVAPGGILPVASAGAAPVVAPSQLMYDIATGALLCSPYTPYPLAGSAASWYAYDSSTAAFASLSVVITADGVSDYRIVVQAADTNSSGSGKGGGHSGQLQILCDGTQMDAINTLTANGSPFDHCNAGWTYYTSGAQGTTMSAGTHTIEFTSDFCELIGPAFIRVDQVVT